MTKTQKASTRYAKILLTHALQKGLLHQIKDGVVYLENQIKKNKTLASVLQAPTLSSTAKKRILILYVQQELHPMLMQFLTILLDQHQINHLKEILSSFIDVYHNYMGVQPAVLTTAVSLPASWVEVMIKEIKQLVTCREVLLKQHIDASIIGGYVLQIGALKLDKSIKHQLFLLKNRFSQ